MTEGRGSTAAHRSVRSSGGPTPIARGLTLSLIPSLTFTVGLSIALAITIVLGAAGRSAAQGPNMPLRFKMVAEFHDPHKDQDAGGVNAFTVNILRKTWIVDIHESYMQQGGVLGTTVLQQIYPPILTFTGPKKITDQLTDPAVEGKTYTLTGQLYIKQRVFQINTVEGPKGEEGAEAESAPDAESKPGSPKP